MQIYFKKFLQLQEVNAWHFYVTFDLLIVFSMTSKGIREVSSVSVFRMMKMLLL